MFNRYSYLYVEDDLLSCEIMQMIMENAMSVEQLTIFTDGTDFMERLKALHPIPNVIMLDIHLQLHNGFDLLAMLRADPDYQDTTVIALTASVMNEEVENLRLSGFDGAIAKPLSVQVFPGLMERILNGDAVWHVA